MDVSGYMGVVIGFYQAHPLVTVAIALVLAYLLYRRPKFFLSILLLAVILAVMAHFILKAGSSGVSVEEKAINKGSVRQED
ncbi:MAG TPA: hypothetical protein VEI96_13335 [Thermodesulfovibrionales bacterium]|nr:hypothetical protein [Thermodesulfovibrionales bacterium]